MTEEIRQDYPDAYMAINEATIQAEFSMASDPLTCSLLRTLAAVKPNGNFLELGTGTGLSASWILNGMDQSSTLLSIDNDAEYLAIASRFLGSDSRLSLCCADGGEWIDNNKHLKFDYIFADTWHGKYLMLDEVIAMLKPGGLYIIDDMLPQPNWPQGHQDKAIKLLKELDSREDLFTTKQCWATGIVMVTKREG